MSEPVIIHAQSGGQIAAILDPDGWPDIASIDSPRERELSDACSLIVATIARTVFDGDSKVRSVQDRVTAEADRVGALLARDRLDAAEEEARRAAQLEMDNGVTVNVYDTVVPPTPEWLAKTAHRIVHVGADNWTDRSAHEPVRTVRRVSASAVYRIHTDGRITERQFKACVWYRDRHEAAGLDGGIKSASFEPRIAGGVASGLPFTASQMEAKDEYWNARLLVPLRIRAFFEIVVLDDKSLSAAKTMAYAGKDPIDSLRCCADRVADYIEYSTGKSL